MSAHLVKSSKSAIALDLVAKDGLETWLAGLEPAQQAWAEANRFGADAGKTLLLPDENGGAGRAAVGLGDGDDIRVAAGGARALPEGTYKLSTKLSAEEATAIAASWALDAYSFKRYADRPGGKAKLVWPKGADRARVEGIAEGVGLARDLINTPANDMGPADLAAAVQALGKRYKAKVKTVVGDALLKQNFPTIHAVGRASDNAPRLIDLTWGSAKAPKVTLVGKGVCFDTGGLDLKPASGMLNMKKDMGGAANVIAVATMIMATGLPVRLRLLVPAVENSVAGNAMRPRDVIKTRKGLTVEIGNTDAEGRLILCDALDLAMAEKPDLVVDCATLTGAARVALGTDLPALFCNDDALADDLLASGLAAGDALWRLPLHKPYRKLLDSDIADINNVSAGGFGGAITAALYLESFVDPSIPWAHIDMMGWNNTSRPGRPKGGEAQSALAIFEMLRRRYG